MFNQTKAAIIVIMIIIPLSIIAIWNSSRIEEFPINDIENHKLVALASFYPLFEFTKEIGKDKVNVSMLVPHGMEPHDWEPSIQDLKLIQSADIIIINGIGFENWIEDIIKINSEIKIIDTSSGINVTNKSDMDKDNHVTTLADPHIWLSPVLAKIQVKNIEEGLKELDKENSQFYHDSSENYIQKLDTLDFKIKTELSNCTKNFIAFHNAFTYFATEYGLNQYTVVSDEPHGEPTSKNIEKIINLAKELKIKVIFTEEGVDQRTAQVIAREINGKVLTLSPIEIGDKNSTYLEKMNENLANLKEALCN